MMRGLFKVEITGGEIDQPRLQALRQSLALKGHARLSDDWDEEFGTRFPRGEDHSVWIMLLRDPWLVRVSYNEDTPKPSQEEIDTWKREIVTGIEAAGLETAIVDLPAK